MYVDAVNILLQIHVASQPVAVRLIKHRPVTGRASVDLLKDFLQAPGAFQTSYDTRPGTVRLPDGRR